MSDNNDNGEWVYGLGMVVGIVCAIAAYSKGGWIVAIIGFVVGWGAVVLAFKLLGIFIVWAIVGVGLFIGFAILKNRVEWIGSLFS